MKNKNNHLHPVFKEILNKHNDLSEQLAEALNPTTNAELIRQAGIEAEIKQIQKENSDGFK